jgi:hypothetical protein
MHHIIIPLAILFAAFIALAVASAIAYARPVPRRNRSRFAQKYFS